MMVTKDLKRSYEIIPLLNVEWTRKNRNEAKTVVLGLHYLNRIHPLLNETFFFSFFFFYNQVKRDLVSFSICLYRWNHSCPPQNSNKKYGSLIHHKAPANNSIIRKTLKFLQWSKLSLTRLFNWFHYLPRSKKWIE